MAEMKVFSLLTVPHGHSYKNCTMVLDSIRVGFPNAELFVDINTKEPSDWQKETWFRAKNLGAFPSWGDTFTHFGWIAYRLRYNPTEETPIVFVDGDVCFWDNMEDTDLSQSVWKGMYIPGHMN